MPLVSHNPRGTTTVPGVSVTPGLLTSLRGLSVLGSSFKTLQWMQARGNPASHPFPRPQNHAARLTWRHLAPAPPPHRRPAVRVNRRNPEYAPVQTTGEFWLWPRAIHPHSNQAPGTVLPWPSRATQGTPYPRWQKSTDWVTQSNPIPLHTEEGRIGATQHVPHSGYTGARTVWSRTTYTHFSSVPGTVLQGLPGATQHTPHSKLYDNTAGTTWSKLVCPPRD